MNELEKNKKKFTMGREGFLEQCRGAEEWVIKHDSDGDWTEMNDFEQEQRYFFMVFKKNKKK